MDEIDARQTIYGEKMQTCKFNGEETNKEKTLKCKFYEKSDYRPCCMWFYPEIDHCCKQGD